MIAGSWGKTDHALTVVGHIMRAPLPEVLPMLSNALVELVPHHAVVMLTGDCPKSATWSHGDPVLIADITSTELATLSTGVDVGVPWFGSARIAGQTRPVLAVSAIPEGSAGALLAVLTSGEAPSAEVLTVVQRLWELTTMRIINLLPQAVPVDMAAPWLTSSAHARVMANVADTHATTLTALLGVLRSRTLDDPGARRTAIDLAASALVELRSASQDGPVAPEETVKEAFTRLTDMLGLLSRYSGLSLEFSAPECSSRPIPTQIAQAARTTTRGTVLTMLEQGDVGRIRVSWQVDDAELCTTIRDDGPGTLSADALAMHRLTDRVTALGGSLHVDSVLEWGTIVTVRLPLTAPDLPSLDLLSSLNPRERDVLRLLVSGHRNRVIATRLHISEHTVKFHVAKILRKFNVDTRGEAAALARAAGFPSALMVAN